MVVVAAVIEKQGLFLLVRRAAHKSDPGIWEFPGGKIEPGESPQTALARELREELALKTQINTLLHQSRHREIDFQAYRVEIESGQPTLRDHDRIEWVTAAKLPGFAMNDFDQEVAAILGRLNG